MTSSCTTPNVPAVLTGLAAAGITEQTIAAELKVSPRTVRRWAAGVRPAAHDLAALRELVDDLRRQICARHSLANSTQLRALDIAAEEFTTEQERAERARLADRVRLTIQRAATDRPVPVAARVDDPFTLLNPDRLGDVLDAAFGGSA